MYLYSTVKWHNRHLCMSSLKYYQTQSEYASTVHLYIQRTKNQLKRITINITTSSMNSIYYTLKEYALIKKM